MSVALCRLVCSDTSKSSVTNVLQAIVHRQPTLPNTVFKWVLFRHPDLSKVMGIIQWLKRFDNQLQIVPFEYHRWSASESHEREQYVSDFGFGWQQAFLSAAETHEYVLLCPSHMLISCECFNRAVEMLKLKHLNAICISDHRYFNGECALLVDRTARHWLPKVLSKVTNNSNLRHTVKLTPKSVLCEEIRQGELLNVEGYTPLSLTPRASLIEFIDELEKPGKRHSIKRELIASEVARKMKELWGIE